MVNNVLPISHFRLYDSIQRAIDEEIAVQTQPIADGVPNTLEEYKYKAGIIRGLVLAQEIAEDIKKKLLGE